MCCRSSRRTCSNGSRTRRSSPGCAPSTAWRPPAPRGSDWEPPRTELPFPVVMKAARTADMAGVRFEGKKKVWFLEEPEELAALVRSIAAAGYAGRLVLQELIPGDDTAEGSITAYT